MHGLGGSSGEQGLVREAPEDPPKRAPFSTDKISGAALSLQHALVTLALGFRVTEPVTCSSNSSKVYLCLLKPCGAEQLSGRVELFTVGALVIRVGFWRPIYFYNNKDPQNSK